MPESLLNSSPVQCWLLNITPSDRHILPTLFSDLCLNWSSQVMMRPGLWGWSGLLGKQWNSRPTMRRHFQQQRVGLRVEFWSPSQYFLELKLCSLSWWHPIPPFFALLGLKGTSGTPKLFIFYIIQCFFPNIIYVIEELGSRIFQLKEFIWIGDIFCCTFTFHGTDVRPLFWKETVTSTYFT